MAIHAKTESMFHFPKIMSAKEEPSSTAMINWAVSWRGGEPASVAVKLIRNTPDCWGVGVQVKVLPVTVLLMFRYPGEKVQPYAGIGGGVFLSHLKGDADLGFVGGSGGGSFKDYQADAGFDARAGLAVKVHKKISIFAEGRYVYFNPKYEDKFDGEKVTLSTDVESIQALAGISFHF